MPPSTTSRPARPALLGVLLLMVLVSGCGGSADRSGGEPSGQSAARRPTVTALAAALRAGGPDGVLGGVDSDVDAPAARCIAAAVLDSGMSTAGLRALVARDQQHPSTPADRDALTATRPAVRSCLVEGLTRGRQGSR